MSCDYSMRFRACITAIGLKVGEWLDCICSIEEPVAYSIVEVAEVLRKIARASPADCGELFSTLFSSISELDSVLRGFRGEGVPYSLYRSIREAFANCSREASKNIAEKLVDLARMVCKDGRTIFP